MPAAIRPARRACPSRVTYGRRIGTELLLSADFDRSRISELRHAVASAAEVAGLSGDGRDDFVVAVDELLTNAVRHGGGRGHLQLWEADGKVRCEVSDGGTGLDQPWPDTPGLPPPDQPGGRGLWLAGALADALEIKSGEGGTTVRITSRTP